MNLITQTSLARDGAIIDVGGGASSLVDQLLEASYSDITLLDISSIAIDETRSRLIDRISYIRADITQWTPTRSFDLWHDRAVFHFLISPREQDTYRAVVAQGTKSGSHLLLATFAPTGPESCSGLAVKRWGQEELAEYFSHEFNIVSTHETTHTTPWGSTQPFTWLYAIRK